MEEMTGGTFTITNGGVFGSLMSTPIINIPQSAILGMHKIQERPDGYQRQGGSTPDDVCSAELRSPHYRRPRERKLPRKGKRIAGKPGADAVRPGSGEDAAGAVTDYLILKFQTAGSISFLRFFIGRFFLTETQKSQSLAISKKGRSYELDS